MFKLVNEMEMKKLIKGGKDANYFYTHRLLRIPWTNGHCNDNGQHFLCMQTIAVFFKLLYYDAEMTDGR